MLEDKLNVKCERWDIKDCYRIGVKYTGKNRPVSIELINFELKQIILKKSGTLLKGKGIYFSPEYTKVEYQKRKALRNHLVLARGKNHSAYIKNNKLIVNGKTYTYENLIEENTFEKKDLFKKNSEDQGINGKNQHQSKGVTFVPNYCSRADENNVSSS
ncbi:unnamed protein product [Psylliodes chrysocephalus]|uniref:Uncharacterized protein n=1 Tax=Psylliodes chrysocephalus TaxID=3402493 RepID=A0A9P0CTU8_9CUCU|nr:unnamed protein product [Psylliodes chrysocephala]